MKIMNSKSAAATLILAASVIPAFGQGRGHGAERGSERSGRPPFEQRGESPRGNSFRSAPQAEQRFQSEQRYQPAQRYQSEQRYQPAQHYQPSYEHRGNWRGNAFGGARHYVIPQNRFYSSFGRDHFFRIGWPVFYGRYPRFQYGGFWFSFAGPAPAYWGADWYNSDDVYIDYNDGGYYLYDNRYPGQGVPLEVDNGDVSSAPPDSAYDGTYDGSYDDGYNGSYPNQY